MSFFPKPDGYIIIKKSLRNLDLLKLLAEVLGEEKKLNLSYANLCRKELKYLNELLREIRENKSIKKLN